MRTVPPGILKKALLASAFFVAVSLAHGACLPGGDGSAVRVRQVLDGDTLVLADGRHVRLIGVNTPEMAGRGRGAEPLAREAHQLLQRLAGRGAGLRLYGGAQDLDRYGRTLAHLVDGDGRLLSEALIASGLGFALAIPPNTRLAGCLFTVERQARLQRRGLWQRSPVVRLDAKPPLRSGFGVWRGRVSGVGGSARGAWLELEERIFVRLGPGDLPARARQLEGRVVELRGWLIDRRQGGRKLDSGRLRWLLDIQDPRHLSPVD